MAPKKKAATKATASEEPSQERTQEPTTTTTTTTAVESPVMSAAESAVPADASAVHAPVPHVVVEVTGTPTEVFSQLQSLITEDAARINDYVPQLLELVQAAENPATPLLLRVRFLEFVGRTVAELRDNSALKKVVTSLVKVIGGEDNTPQLLSAAIQCFTGLGPVSMLDKRWEYLSREGADVLMQVLIDKEAFSEPVRQSASKTMDSLTHSAFRSVVTKLLHWVSDDREEDEEEQINKEHHMALARLTRLALAPSMRVHWTEEMQQYALALIQRVMNTADAAEFMQLARVAASLPMIREKGGVPLIEAFVASYPLDNDRALEALGMLARFIRATGQTQPELDLVPALEAVGLLASNVDISSEHGVLASRVLLLACRLATEEGSEKLFQYTFEQLRQLIGSGAEVHGNLVTIETVLLAATAIARKRSADVLQALTDETLSASLKAYAEAIAAMEQQAIFAVKKMVQRGEAKRPEQEVLCTLHNIKVVAGAFAARHLPMGELYESWSGRYPLPVLKRSRDEKDPLGVLPPPPGSAAAAATSNHRGQKRSGQQRSPQRGWGGNGNQNNRNNNGGNPRKKARTQSSNRRR